MNTISLHILFYFWALRIKVFFAILRDPFNINYSCWTFYNLWTRRIGVCWLVESFGSFIFPQVHPGVSRHCRLSCWNFTVPPRNRSSDTYKYWFIDFYMFTRGLLFGQVFAKFESEEFRGIIVSKVRYTSIIYLQGSYRSFLFIIREIESSFLIWFIQKVTGLLYVVFWSKFTFTWE